MKRYINYDITMGGFGQPPKRTKDQIINDLNREIEGMEYAYRMKSLKGESRCFMLGIGIGFLVFLIIDTLLSK